MGGVGKANDSLKSLGSKTFLIRLCASYLWLLTEFLMQINCTVWTLRSQFTNLTDIVGCFLGYSWYRYSWVLFGTASRWVRAVEEECMRGSNQINSTRALSVHQHAIALSLFWWCVVLILMLAIMMMMNTTTAVMMMMIRTMVRAVPITAPPLMVIKGGPTYNIQYTIYNTQWQYTSHNIQYTIYIIPTHFTLRVSFYFLFLNPTYSQHIPKLNLTAIKQLRGTAVAAPQISKIQFL